jgi:hypothetical protein
MSQSETYGQKPSPFLRRSILFTSNAPIEYRIINAFSRVISKYIGERSNHTVVQRMKTELTTILDTLAYGSSVDITFLSDKDFRVEIKHLNWKEQ